MIEPDSSALVIVVREAESLVAPFRRRYDPSASGSMPAHITLLYPFKPPNQIDKDVLSALESLFCTYPCFQFELATLGRFARTLYLKPEPGAPFLELLGLLRAQYPDILPYGGEHDQFIPHLTIAHSEDRQELDAIEVEFLRHAHGSLPLECLADRVWLYERRLERWEERAPFDFELR